MVHKWTIHIFSPGSAEVIHPDQNSKDGKKDEAQEGKKDEDSKDERKDEDSKEDKKHKDKKEDKIVEVEKEEKKGTDDKDDKIVGDDKDDQDLEPRVVNPKTDEQCCRLQEACRDVLLFTTLDQVSNGQILHQHQSCMVAL